MARSRSINFIFFLALTGFGWYSIRHSLYPPYLQCLIILIYSILVVLLFRKDLYLLNKNVDSVYYLGFMFTLLAILESLYAFNINSENNVLENLQGFIKNVGIALWTTIVGITIRFGIIELVSKGKNISIDFKQETYLSDLQEAYSKFVHSHDQLSRTIEDFVIARKEDIVLSNKEKKEYHAEVEKFSNELSQIIQQFESLTEELKKVHLKEELSATAQVAGNLNNQLSGINENIKVNQKLCSVLEESLDSYARLMEEKVLKLGEIEVEATRKEINDLFIELTAQLKKIVSTVQEKLIRLE